MALPPDWADAALIMADGKTFWGYGAGAVGMAVGEICFNTSVTGYQEILTDPSYAGQIITFTFPHIGNVGTSEEDMESENPAVRGCIFREEISTPSNWRSAQHLDQWLKAMQLTAVTGIDTRRLARRIRDNGATKATIIFSPEHNFDVKAAQKSAMLTTTSWHARRL